ncbi:AAA family ATPase [Pseudarthrobacter cellobiosi]|uniref:AAA family ATPase n=1 Tax=Pseudarthrobacter cellobiosi TaxID=2953654 RepID=UPI0027E22460|nr:AAA family ATPase [Pseudarthrobacter sp. HLT1-5]
MGKTLSARRYANWHKAENLLISGVPGTTLTTRSMQRWPGARSVFYTPAALTSPKQIHAELEHISTRVSICVDQHLEKIGKKTGPPTRTGKHVELLIIDESERLNATALELLRDRYDRDNIALILIGMPGIEKWFSRYAQLYSRVGFAHEYRPLAQEELHFVLERRWHKLGQTLNPEDFTDAQAIAAVARITRGNIRLIDRLFTQVERVMKINELNTITDDVIEAARSTLVIGIS